MDLRRNLSTFQGKMEFMDFLRPSPKIQGLFKTVRTLVHASTLGELAAKTTPFIMSITTNHNCPT